MTLFCPPARRRYLVRNTAASLLAASCVIVFGLSCRVSNSPSDTTPGSADATAAGIEALTSAAILTGEPVEANARLMTLRDAEIELLEFGAVFPEFEEYPPSDTQVWLVEVLGTGIQPGPAAGVDSDHECLEMRVILFEDTLEELTLLGRPVANC